MPRKQVNENGHLVLSRGDYGKDESGVWYCWPPDCVTGMGSLKNHDVIEHEDGTITVSPSILIQAGDNEIYWHGYLKKGVWTKC